MKDNNRVGYLIDLIKSKNTNSPDKEKSLYKELLLLAIEKDNLYGQALAYISFSRMYLYMQQHEKYTECMEKAYQIANQEKYVDILISYYNFEGVRYMQNYEEANAISMYLKGISLAMEIFDYNHCAVLYNNIAEVFYKNFYYDKAIVYYLKALSILEKEKDTTYKQYYKAILENLIISYCYNGDLVKAKKYLQDCKSVECYNTIHPFAQEEAELRVLLLEGKKEETLIDAIDLFKRVKESNKNDNLLFHVYSFLCDIFLEFNKKEEALFCLSKLEKMKIELNQNNALETQKRKIRYHQVFNINSEDVFQEFYDLVLQFESNNTKAVLDSLSATISLYETEKEKQMIKKEHQKLEHAVQYDPLTGTYNRRVFNQIVEESLQKESVKEIAYIMIDIDYFKAYNDYYGHHKGDIVLKTIGSLLQKALPKQAYLCRYGGDEFACLLINKSIQEVETFTKSIHGQVKAQKLVHVQALKREYLTLSMGVFYTSKKEAMTIDVLLQKADEALYRVKNSGRNGYHISSK